MANLKDGYKLWIEAGKPGDDSFLLLAGGGKKDITKLNYVSGLSWSDNKLLWSVDGTAKTAITIGYATNAGTATNLSGGTISVAANKYRYDGTYGILMNNSDIIGANSIYFDDTSDSASEGIHFWRSSNTTATYYDTLWANGGNLYFTPNHAQGNSGTNYTIYHTGNKPTASDVGIKFGYTTSGNNRAVVQDSNGNLYVVLKDDNDTGYLPLTGGTLTGNITFSGDNKISWSRNTDAAEISFKNTGDADTDSYMLFHTADNGNEYFKWNHTSGSTTTDWMTLKSDGLRVGGTKVSLEGHTHSYAGSQSSGGPADYVRWELGESNVNRRIPFAWGDNVETTDSRIRLVYHNNFLYNPATNVLTVGSITGNAATATTAGGLYANGSLTTDPGDYKLYYNRFLADSACTMPVLDNANAALTVKLHSGNYYTQLGFSSNGRLYERHFHAEALNTTKNWNTIAWVSDIPTNTNLLTNGAGFITSSGSCNYSSSSGNADTVDSLHASAFTRSSFSPCSGSDNSMTSCTDFSTWVSRLNSTGIILGTSSITTGAWWWVRSVDFQVNNWNIRTSGAMIIHSGSGTNTDKNYKHFLILDANGDLYGITSNEESWKKYSKFAKTGEALPANGGTSTYTNYLKTRDTSVSISSSTWANNPWGASNMTVVWGQSGKYAAASNDTADITLLYGTLSSAGGAGWFLNIDGGIYTLSSMYAPSYYTNSDIRYKNIVSNIELLAKDIANLPLFTYIWKDGRKDKLVHVGSSAQSVEVIVPELVSQDNDGFRSLDYPVLGVVAGITACREILKNNSRIEQLENEVKELRKELLKYKK